MPLGMESMNTTPPASCLWADTFPAMNCCTFSGVMLSVVRAGGLHTAHQGVNITCTAEIIYLRLTILLTYVNQYKTKLSTNFVLLVH